MYVSDDADVDSLEEAAGDGSVSHQVALGSHLLRVAQTSDTEEGDELAQRAVKWLLLASCQGDTDAKEKLTYCLNNNIGKLSIKLLIQGCFDVGPASETLTLKTLMSTTLQ